MYRLTNSQLVMLNKKITGDKCEVKNENLLDKINNQVYEQDEEGFYVYRDTVHKAAKYAEIFSYEQPFMSGNLETGVLIATTLLSINNNPVNYTDEDIKKFMADLEKHDINYEDIVSWLKARTKPNTYEKYDQISSEHRKK